MKKQHFVIAILAIVTLMTACGGAVTSIITKTTDASPSDPKGSIAYQFDLLKAGDADKLRACFTDRVKDSVTKESVEKGKSEAAKYTLDDLVGSVEMGEYEGKKTAKIKMKNGRTLTTLIETNNKWLADTIWFK
jgi:hypothetical protein